MKCWQREAPKSKQAQTSMVERFWQTERERGRKEKENQLDGQSSLQQLHTSGRAQDSLVSQGANSGMSRPHSLNHFTLQ